MVFLNTTAQPKWLELGKNHRNHIILQLIRNSKSGRFKKLHDWFESYTDFAGLGRFCLVIEFYHGSFDTKGGTMSIFCLSK